MKWTDEQREAIEYRNKNILLAAAAGSGKTAVLVQRVIEMIEKDEVSVDELLVLTFTDAAASEMREKIKKAINAALRENPENEHLQKQKLLIHASSISTVHSFCMNTLKSNIYLTDLPVEFSLVSDTERTIMLNEALDEVLERFYRRIDVDYSFSDLVVGYGGIKNDKTLREIVLNLHKFSLSMAYPSKWLNDSVKEYKHVAKYGALDDGWLKCRQREFAEKTKSEISEIYEQIIRIIDDRLPNDHPYVEFFGDEAANLSRVFEHMNPGEYASVEEALGYYKFPNIKAARGITDEDILATQAKIKSLREAAKSSFNDLKKCFAVSEEDMLERMRKTYPMLRTLKNIVLMVDRCFVRKKRSKNALDFNDLEHEMLKLISASNGVESEVAQKLREKYRAILVDEYQDTNNVQDAIFRTVSRDNSNIFMVGDLKQSIYKFRNAVPELFSEKYKLYDEDDSKGHLIQLFRNFRSRDGVVDTVNFLFGRLMSSEVGNIEYTEREYLMFGAEYYPEVAVKADYDTEFHMICKDIPDADGAAAESFDKTEIEAKFVANRIGELIRTGFEVFDKDKGVTRKIEYRDIVILLRNPRNIAPVIEKIFDEANIPVYTEVGHSYLGSPEIGMMLAFLQIVDNPRQDIPLIAVLRSAVWGFDDEELAKIRADYKKGCFLDSVIFAAEKGNVKAMEFISDLERLRKKSEYSGVDRLISDIYYDLGYYAYVGSEKRGDEKQANLRLLLEHATDFERTRLSGLFSFMNYLETMRSVKGDLVPAKTFGEGANVVRIMSIHKSKGLEFPVVFLMDTAHMFNTKDASKTVIWDGNGGVGASFIDTKMRIKYSTLQQMFVAKKMKEDFLSEEMRLLYVALTRAREKLIITSTFGLRDKAWMSPVWDENGNVAVACVRGSSSYREWLAAAFAVHPDGKNLRDYCGIGEDVVKIREACGMSVFVYGSAAEIECAAEQRVDVICETDTEDAGLEAEIKRRFEFTYPGEELENLPVKLSVSEVKRMQAEEADYVPLIEQLRSSDVSELRSLSGAEKGTVIHFVLQLLEPEKIESGRDVEDVVQRLKEEKVLTDAQAAVVDCTKIARFFSSNMGRRMKSAVRRETEFSFYSEVPASEVFGDERQGNVLIQGTVDCFFVEKDGRTVLLDFKTDRVKDREGAEKAAEKYKLQMKYYKKALTEILETEVDECYLYFMECDVFIDMNQS